MGVLNGNAFLTGNVPRLDIIVYNWGVIPAEHITLKLELFGTDSGSEALREIECVSAQLGNLFPSQEVPLVFLVSPEKVPGNPALVVRATLSYRSNTQIDIANWSFGRYSHIQSFAIDANHFGILADVKFPELGDNTK